MLVLVVQKWVPEKDQYGTHRETCWSLSRCVVGPVRGNPGRVGHQVPVITDQYEPGTSPAKHLTSFIEDSLLIHLCWAHATAAIINRLQTLEPLAY